MKHKNKFLIGSLIAILIFSSFNTVTVFADDSAPPPDSPVTEEAPPIEDVPPVTEEIPAPEESAPVEESPVVDESQLEENPAPETSAEESSPESNAQISSPVEESPVEEINLPEILEQIPEDSGLLVLDENGDALPLASKETAEIISRGADPYFNDGGVIHGYTSGGPGSCPPVVNVCHDSIANPIQAAVDAFTASATATGSIYVEAGNYAENVTISGISNLTGLIGAGSGTTTINGNISLTNNMNAFTLQGFTINGGFAASFNSGDLQINDISVTNPFGIGINVNDHSGDIQLRDITANGNLAGNAILNNTAGSGNIVIEGDNSFNNSHGIGLMAQSNGSISANNVAANENMIGATLVGGDITLTGNNTFDNNDAAGLIVSSSGSINANGMSASGNSISGATLTASGSVALTGTNVFNDNSSIGLTIAAANVNTNNVTANGNGMYGAVISGADVTLSGINIFNNNSNYGLMVTAGGDIYISNITAVRNQGGTILSNTSGNGDITLAGTNTFENNVDVGLNALSNGTLTLHNITAANNGMLGLMFTSAPTVVIHCGNISGSSFGIVDSSNAAFTLDGVNFSGNGTNIFTSGTVTTSDNCGDAGGGGAVGGGASVFVPKPWQVIYANEPQSASPDCSIYAGVIFILPNGDKAIFFCEVNGEVFAEGRAALALPAALPFGTFISALRAGSANDSGFASALKVSFVIPENMKDAELAILYWSGTEWVELSGQRAGDFFEVVVNFTGTFVMVKRAF